jgi:MFS family permease
VFGRFWIASTTSGVGSSVTAVAVPLLALSVLKSSSFEVSALSAAGQAGWLLLGLPAGVIVQHLALRRFQVALDVVRAIAMVSIPLAWITGVLSYGQLVVVALVVGFATVLSSAANMTFVPSVIPRADLMSRNSFLSGTDAVIQTAGPGLAGLLVQLVGSVAAILVDAVSYAVSALVMRTLPERRVAGTGTGSLFGQIRDGFAFVGRHRVMLPCVVFATLINFADGGVIALAPIYLVRNLGAPAVLVGIMLACQGLGSFLGATVATRLSRRIGSARTAIVAAIVSGLFVLLLPLTGDLRAVALFAIGNAGFTAGMVVGSIVTRTHRQTDSPPELLSRVMTTVRFISWSVIPIGALVAGALAASLGVRPGLAVICAFPLLGAVVLVLSPVRSRRDLSDEPTELAVGG